MSGSHGPCDAALPNPPTHRELPTPGRLQPWVRRLLHSSSDGPTRYTVAVPPTGACYFTHIAGAPMTLRYSDGRPRQCPPLFIGGQLKREMPVAEISGRVGLLGVEFRPTALYRLFHRDCSVFTDRLTDVRAFVPADGEALVRALDAEEAIAAKAAVLTAFLERWSRDAAEPSPVDQAVEHIEREGGCVTVAAVAEGCGWSVRHLHRRFLHEVGIGPKLYAKVVQVNSAVAAIGERGGRDLQHVAQDCGYYDQAQFIHDFQRLIGTNPMRFLRHPDPFLRVYLGRVGARLGHGTRPRATAPRR